jgi:signal transduction histidine kinase
VRDAVISYLSFDSTGIVWLVLVAGDVFALDGERASKMGSLYQTDWAAKTNFADQRQKLWSLDIKKNFDRSIAVYSSGKPTELSFKVVSSDRENSLWFGVEGGGLYRLRNQLVKTLSVDDGLIDKNVYSIFEDRGGDVWIGAWHAGLSRFRDGHITNYSTKEGLASGLVTSVYEDRQRRLWVAAWHNFNGGLSVFRDGHFVPAFEKQIVPRQTQIWAIYEDRFGALWFGSSRGLVRYHHDLFETFTTKDGLAGDDVRIILEDESGLWIGTYGGLSRFENGRFTSWTEKDGLPSNAVRSLYKDADGTLWIGTYEGGLGRLKDNQLTRITARDGLYSNGVFQILEDRRGYFWMSSNRGIYRVERRELDEFAEGRRSAVNVTAFGRSDGMLNAECNGGMAPAGIKARDGRLWFPTQDGAAVIDPEAVVVNNVPPPVVIETAKVDNQTIGFATVSAASESTSAEIKLDPGAVNLEIQYTALSFLNAENMRFKYRLEGWDEEWVEAGTRRTAYYSRLAPGEYTFRVIAANSDGVWNDEGESLKITVLPRFYQTWWFYALTVLSIGLLVRLLYVYRLRQLEKISAAKTVYAQQLIESQEYERRRIAVELHDSIGQSLIVIRNRALMSLSTPDKHLKMVAQMEEISKSVAESIEEVRYISHNLHPHQLEYLGLTTALEAMIEAAAGSSGIEFAAEIDGVDDLLPKEAEINLYRIIQEGLNNILKHSGAARAVVSLKKTDGFLKLRIEDDGRGFYREKSSPPSRGLGLTGIAERAKMLGAEQKIISVPGTGTVISVQIKLPIKE